MLQSVDPKRRERILQCFFIVSKNALTHNVMLTPSPLIKASVKDLGLNGGGGGKGHLGNCAYLRLTNLIFASWNINFS